MIITTINRLMFSFQFLLKSIIHNTNIVVTKSLVVCEECILLENTITMFIKCITSPEKSASTRDQLFSCLQSETQCSLQCPYDQQRVT